MLGLMSGLNGAGVPAIPQSSGAEAVNRLADETFDDSGAGFSLTEIGIPPTCDVFVFSRGDFEKFRAKGYRIDHCRLEVYRSGEKVRIAGTWPLEQVSTSWILQTFGPGLYDVTGCDAEGNYRKRARMTLGDPNQTAGASPGPTRSVPHGNGGLGEALALLAQLKSLGMFGAPAQDPIREAVGAIMASSAAMQKSMMEFMQLQMAMAEKRQADPTRDVYLSELVKLKLGGSERKSGSVEELAAMLKIAKELLGKSKEGGGEDKPSDVELLLDTARPMLPPLASLMVHFIPEPRQADFLAILNEAAKAMNATGEPADAGDAA